MEQDSVDLFDLVAGFVVALDDASVTKADVYFIEDKGALYKSQNLEVGQMCVDLRYVQALTVAAVKELSSHFHSLVGTRI